MQEQCELIGLPAVTRCAIRSGIELVLLDHVFHIAASAIDLLIKMLGPAGQVGNDEADIAAFRGCLYAGNDFTSLRPAFCLIIILEKASTFFLATGRPACGHILAPWMGKLLQSLVAGKTKDILATKAVKKVHDFRHAIMSVATHTDLNPWPSLPDPSDDMAQDKGCFFARSPLAFSQDKTDRFACCCVIDMDRLEAVAASTGLTKCAAIGKTVTTRHKRTLKKTWDAIIASRPQAPACTTFLPIP